MSLHAYASHCELLEEELLAILSKEDVDALRKDVAEMHFRNWYLWRIHNRQEVAAFLQSPPSVRGKKRRWAEPVLLRRLVLAALHQLHCARVLLENLSCNPLEPGCSYREMAVKAADFYADTFLRQKVPNWPFEEPDPFHAYRYG